MSPEKSLKYYYTRSKETLVEGGPLVFGRMAYKKIKNTVLTSNDAFWFFKDLEQSIPQIQPSKKVEVDFDSDLEIMPWLEKHHIQFTWLYRPKEIAVKAENNHLYPVVKEGKDIIGYIKIGINKVYLHDFDGIFDLPKDTAMVYDTFVLPEYRGFGIATFLITESAIYLRNLGFKNFWCHIPPWNQASINAFSKAGFKQVDYIRYTRLLGRKIFTKDIEKMLADNV